MKINFIKMQALSNDFVIINNLGNPKLELSEDTIKFLCNRRVGIGCDQLVIIESPRNHESDALLVFYNNDGSPSCACGNASRCIVKYLCQSFDKDKVLIEFQNFDGAVEGRITNHNMVKLNLFPPKFEWQDIPLTKPVNTDKINLGLPYVYDGFAVNVGNPQIVFFVDKLHTIDVPALAMYVQKHELFSAEGVNVNFAEIISRDYIKLKTFERGAGLTPACGTGSCATAIAAIEMHNLSNTIKVSSDGGDLYITYHNHKLAMVGEANLVYEGEIKIAV